MGFGGVKANHWSDKKILRKAINFCFLLNAACFVMSLSEYRRGWLKRKHQEAKLLFSEPVAKRYCSTQPASMINKDADSPCPPFYASYSFCLSNLLVQSHKTLKALIEKAGGKVSPFLSKKVKSSPSRLCCVFNSFIDKLFCYIT